MQAERAGLVLGVADAVLGRQAAVVDLLEHLDHRDVGPAVQRAPQGADGRGAGGEQVGLAEPTIRTVEVLQFCSWSACRMKIRFSASSTSGVTTYCW